jgi:hypothetical protein
MAARTPTGFDDSVRPDDVAVEEALADEPVEEGEPPTPTDAPLPAEADEADVLEQRREVPADEDDEALDL